MKISMISEIYRVSGMQKFTMGLIGVGIGIVLMETISIQVSTPNFNSELMDKKAIESREWVVHEIGRRNNVGFGMLGGHFIDIDFSISNRQRVRRLQSWSTRTIGSSQSISMLTRGIVPF